MFSLKLYLRDRWILGPGLAAVGILGLLWGYTFRRLGPTPQSVFLHYTVVFGVDWVGSWWQLWLLPGFGTVIFLLNYLVGWFVYSQEKLAARALTVVTFLLMGAILVTLFRLGGLNT